MYDIFTSTVFIACENEVISITWVRPDHEYRTFILPLNYTNWKMFSLFLNFLSVKLSEFSFLLTLIVQQTYVWDFSRFCHNFRLVSKLSICGLLNFKHHTGKFSITLESSSASILVAHMLSGTRFECFDVMKQEAMDLMNLHITNNLIRILWFNAGYIYCQNFEKMKQYHSITLFRLSFMRITHMVMEKCVSVLLIKSGLPNFKFH